VARRVKSLLILSPLRKVVIVEFQLLHNFPSTLKRTVMTAHIKTADEIAAMRVSCRLASEVLDFIAPHVKPGVTTSELDRLCHDYMVDKQACIPAPLHYAPAGYKPYPKSICASVNHVVCHGIPSDKPLKKGDILNLDITTIKDGWHGDTSRMFAVGKPSILAGRLIDVSYNCLWKGISAVRPGGRLGDIGAAIQRHAENNGYSVVRDYCGHGIGRNFHEEPQVMHFGEAGKGIELKAGMTFTIEPMINAGRSAVSVLGDGWTVVTKDRSLSAQWEHTVCVTKEGVEVLSLSSAAPPPPEWYPGKNNLSSNCD